MLKILFVGPLPPPIHGQSIAFEEAYNASKTMKYIVNQNFENLHFFKKIFFTLASMSKTTYYLLFKKIDLVYFTCTRSKFGSLKDIYLIFLSKLLNIKIVNHLHGADVKKFYFSLSRFHRKLLYRAYDKIDVSIVLLPSMKKEFIDIWENMKVEVVPNFYPSELEDIYEKPSNKITKLLYLSNIIASKGVFELLKAVEILDKHNIDYELNIAGLFMGDDIMTAKVIETKFLRIIEKNKKINYLGVVSGKSKKDLLIKSDIFILPTYYKTEAFPISLLEAMRAGAAVITTYHNYLPEIISEQNGILISPKDTGELSNALIDLIENNDKLKSIQSYNIAYTSQNFSSKIYRDKINNILKK